MICRRERERERKRKKRVVQQKKEKAFHDVFDVCLRVRVRCESVRGCGELVWVRLRETLSLSLSLSASASTSPFPSSSFSSPQSMGVCTVM